MQEHLPKHFQHTNGKQASRGWWGPESPWALGSEDPTRLYRTGRLSPARGLPTKLGLQDSAFSYGSWTGWTRKSPPAPFLRTGRAVVELESLTGLVVSIRFYYWLVDVLVTWCREERPGRHSQVLEPPSL